MKNIAIAYTITKSSSWRSKEGVDIKSNLVDDKLIECQIASSLIEDLKKGSALLDPDKLLLGFAEAQKRGIKDNLKSLNDFELSAKNHSNSIQENLLKTEIDLELKYNTLMEKFSAITDKFDSKLISTEKKLTKQINLIKKLELKIKEINTYSFDNISESIQKIINLIEKDPELVKMIFNKKLG